LDAEIDRVDKGDSADNAHANLFPLQGTQTATAPSDETSAKRETVYLRLQQLLREDILTSRIPDGSRLKVGDIADKCNTSTNPAPRRCWG
jgi:hypothetical protein